MFEYFDCLAILLQLYCEGQNIALNEPDFYPGDECPGISGKC